MQVLRLNEVLMRVVAWHNRHPLARRINASQVHSIGEVLLPFAASKPALAPPMAPAANRLPDVADLLDPPQAGTPLLPDGMPDAAAPATTGADDADLGPSPTAVAPAPTTPEAAAGSSPFMLAEDDLAARLAADLHEAANAPAASPDLALPLEPQATQAIQATQATQTTQATPATPAPTPQAAAAATAGATPTHRLKRLLAGLTGRQPGMPRLAAAFSRDFIWPMSPRRVARWARGHGQLEALAPADWPRRVVETDGTLLAAARQQGLAHSVELHVLTAAIGVGDRRLRVLMDAQGAVIGPRAYSRPRLAAAGGLLATALLGLGWTTLLPLLPDASAVLAAAAAASAPAPSASASAAASAEAAAVTAAAALAASSALGAATTSSAPAGVAGNTQHADADAAAPASPEATAPAAQPAEIHAASPATADRAVATARGLAVAATPPADTPVPAPGPTLEAARGSAAPLGRIRPALSDEDKQAARAQTAAMRGDKVDPPRPAAAATALHTVYAVVTRPSPQREVASAGLVVMTRASGRLPQPVPEHSELMQNQGAWRAAWWPFASLADAERARVLLAGKGLKVDVVEF